MPIHFDHEKYDALVEQYAEAVEGREREAAREANNELVRLFGVNIDAGLIERDGKSIALRGGITYPPKDRVSVESAAGIALRIISPVEPEQVQTLFDYIASAIELIGRLLQECFSTKNPETIKQDSTAQLLANLAQTTRMARRACDYFDEDELSKKERKHLPQILQTFGSLISHIEQAQEAAKKHDYSAIRAALQHASESLHTLSRLSPKIAPRLPRDTEEATAREDLEWINSCRHRCQSWSLTLGPTKGSTAAHLTAEYERLCEKSSLSTAETLPLMMHWAQFEAGLVDALVSRAR